MLQSCGSVTACQLESSKPGAAATGFDESPYVPVGSVAALLRLTSLNFQPPSKLVVRVPWLSTPGFGSGGGAASVCDRATCVHASTASTAMSAGTTARVAILNTPSPPPQQLRRPRGGHSRLYTQKARASTCKGQAFEVVRARAPRSGGFGGPFPNNPPPPEPPSRAGA